MSENTPVKKTLQQLEEETISYWKEHRIFERSVELRSEKNKYTFVDGPPFVTGMPHYGSLLPSIAKDVIPRFQTMKGKRVRRVFGWDCHGLPIEEKINKQFRIKSSQQLENEFGVARYVQECRQFVNGCANDWRWYIDRIGRWVDMDHAYYTMSPEFMESVIWAFKQAYDKGLIYRGKRVSLFSTDTSTPVSNFEVAMDADNYRDVEDLAIFVKFELKSVPKVIQNKINSKKPVYLVAWTTTPWTIPANFALAVNESFDYALVDYDDQQLIVAKERLSYTFNESLGHIGKNKGKVVHVVAEFKGKELEGISYKPVYDFFESNATPKDYHVYLTNEVILDEGTGVLHIAPAFGEVDFELGKKWGLSATPNIDAEGKMTVGDWVGQYLREASPMVAEDMQEKGNLLHSQSYTHRLPFYRGENPLIYMIQDAYFINIQQIKSRMMELNEQTNWIPDHFKHGRFQQTIETSPDWCISRNRYWATIMPIWRSTSGKEIVVGSLEEMTQYTKQIEKKNENGKNTYWFKDQKMDLHRDICDQIILQKDGEEYHRIPEVLDCWMDSGSAPFAEYHYPFENKALYEQSIPADFIIEYVGQVRAWFNVLLRISTIIFDKPAFTNVICTGVLSGNDGRKMSKSFGNYPDPKMVLEKYGGDALRLYFMSSPIMMGDDLNIDESGIDDQVKTILNIWWNSYSYYQLYAGNAKEKSNEKNVMDDWIRARLKQTVLTIHDSLEAYDIPTATRAIKPFVNDLSTWYIRRSRNRFVEGDSNAIETLKYVLETFAKAAAPITPFITESMYRGLTQQESVHLEDYPTVEKLSPAEEQLLSDMKVVRAVCSMGQALRVENKMAIKQPLQALEVQLPATLLGKSNYYDIMAEELNVKKVVDVNDFSEKVIVKDENGIKVGLNIEITPELQLEGKLREVVRALQEARKQAGVEIADQVNVEWFSTDEQIQKVFEVFDAQLQKTIKAKSWKKAASADGLSALEKVLLFVKISK